MLSETIMCVWGWGVGGGGYARKVNVTLIRKENNVLLYFQSCPPKMDDSFDSRERRQKIVKTIVWGRDDRDKHYSDLESR